jgi:tyrosine-protein kinase Etk/Wzc
MGQIQTLDELFSFLLRRFKVIALVTLAGMVLTLAYAKSLPRLYEAAAVLQVEAPRVGRTSPEQGGRDAAQMLQTIEQDLTTREAMMAVIERHQLFAGTEGLSADRQAFVLRSAIRFQPITSSTAPAFGGGAAISALIISAQWDDPDLAARIANDFAQSLLDYSAASSRTRAQVSEAFYQDEADQIAVEITKLEAELTAFKNENAAYLPEISAARRDEMIGLETDLRLAEREVATLNGRKAALQATGNQRATDKRQLAEIAAALEVSLAQRNQINARRDELMAALALAPQVDQGLAGFDRRLRQLQDKYDLALGQLAAAQTDMQLAEDNGTEHFALLERANRPEDSVGASRRKVAVMGTLASLFAAIGLAFLFEQVFPVVRTAEQLERQLSIRPIVSIPDLASATARPQLSRVLAMVDDPVRPIFGLPRYLVVAAGATIGLLGLAALLG